MEDQDRQNLQKEKEKEQEEILKVVLERGQTESSNNELVFDPNSGEFVVVKPEDIQNDPDTIPITSVADDGWA